MLNRLFAKRLKLELDDRTLTFNTLADFEFALASRTDVPAAKIAEMVGFAMADLRDEATNIRDVEKRFVEVLAKSLEESGSIGYLLREMDPKLFSQDHQWRVIMRALNQQGREFDEFKKVAVVKYMQYLGSRQDVLKSLFSNRSGNAGAAPEPDARPDPDFKETLLFDVSANPFDEGEVPPFERLPRGETVTLSVPPRQGLEIILSRHLFTLVPGQRVYLADKNGKDYELRPGRNLVGRLPESDVVIDSGYRDVSRKHLVVEMKDDSYVRLTDLSSHGTFVPRGSVEATAGF